MASSSAAADVSITREQLTKYFHLPITDVAKELGICATMLKKICRKNGIPRWPHRKIKSLNKMIESLEASLPNDGSEAGECIRQEIIILKNKKSLIMRNPSILVQGNSNKRSIEGDEQGTPKKARGGDTMQSPITTFNNPKSLPTSAPNSFSINQLLTPPSTFTPLASPSMVAADDKDYRAFTHPHLLSSLQFPSDSKHPIDARVPYPSPLTSYLPPAEDEPRHLETSLLHPPSTDPYYYHKAALAYQYHYPRQMLPPTYPPPPHVLASPHLARNPYYPHFVVPPPQHESPRQLINETHNEQQPQQTQVQQPQQAQVGDGQERDRVQQQQQAQQQAQQTQQQQQTTHLMTVTNATTKQQLAQPSQQPTQQATQLPNPETLPKMNIPSTDMYKFSRPPSPSSSTLPSPYPPSNGDMSHFYFSQYNPQQQQRLPQ